MMRVLVLMAGGGGKRLAGLTGGIPKQFLPLAGGRPMLAEAYEAALPVVDETLVVAGKRWAWAVRQVLPSLRGDGLLVEPRGRNTGPCLVLAASVANRRWGEDTVLLCLPSDFHAGDVAAFRRTLGAACEAAAATGGLVAIAVAASRPEPGFGYMRLEPACADERSPRRVLEFAEKPPAQEAAGLLAEGWLWNTGMYCFRASAFLEEAHLYLPDAWRELSCLPLSPRSHKPGAKALREAYARLEAASVDYAVSQRTQRLYAVTGDFGWDDVSTVESALRAGGPGLYGRVDAWRQRLQRGRAQR